MNLISLQIDEDCDFLLRGISKNSPMAKRDLISKLILAKKENRPLRVKFGIDPTSTELHLGHTVCLNVLKRFQDLGHKVVLILGGFTAQLGDPTGRNEARPPLSEQQVQENLTSYLDQINHLIELDKAEIVNNNEWLSKLALKELIHLSSSVTINQLISKEAFGERLNNNLPLYLHETLYPVLQGYDSVITRADIEIGGQDQLFNVLAGRDLQKLYGQLPQIAFLFPLLVGTDGKKKMSKSSNNFVALKDTPSEMFGKVMSIPDEQILPWSNLCIPSLKAKEIETALQENINPRDAKMLLAEEIVARHHSKNKAEEAKNQFILTFQKKEIPKDSLQFIYISNTLDSIPSLVDCLSGLIGCGESTSWSKGEIRRLITQGGVKVEGQKTTLDFALKSNQLKGNEIIQIGKRHFFKLIVGDSRIA